MADELLVKNEGLAETLKSMEDTGGFQLELCTDRLNLEDKNKFAKFKMTPEQKMQISALVQHIPSVAAANALSNIYVLRFPAGISGTLMRLRGGWAPMLMDSATGRFAAHGALYPLQTSASVMQVFNVMSIASGQYFLSQINSNMKLMRSGINQILEFLYGDKKAELIAEVGFIHSVYENYSSIMAHEQQRISTLVGLQDSKKVAMKDIEFYIVDMDSIVSKKESFDMDELGTKIEQLRNSLDLSMQLYLSSNILEVYCAQNFDNGYLQFIEGDVTSYINKYEKKMLSNYSVLLSYVNGLKDKKMLLKKTPSPELISMLNDAVDKLSGDEKSVMRSQLQSALNSAGKEQKYIVTSGGDVYLQTA